MGVLNSYFSDFLAEIRPNEEQKKAYKEGHQTLRERLTTDKDTAKLVVSTFLQGSYRRATAVRPEGQHRPDVDVIVVTNIDSDDPSNTPDRAVEMFTPFLDRHYPGQHKRQNRSVAITVDGIDLDFVITAKPVENDRRLLVTDAVKSFETPEDIADWRLNEKWIAPGHRFGRYEEALKKAAEEPEWRSDPLKIPDRELQSWELTHPLEQIRWTWQKNGECNSHYVNVVKALKWWRRTQHPSSKYPKGYPFEHIVGDTCPSAIQTIADGVALTLEEIKVRYASDIQNRRVPYLPDRGVPSHSVLHRLSFDDFHAFYDQCSMAADTARKAVEEEDVAASVERWRSLFGDCFPGLPDQPESQNQRSGAFTPRSTTSEPPRARFA